MSKRKPKPVKIYALTDGDSANEILMEKLLSKVDAEIDYVNYDDKDNYVSLLKVKDADLVVVLASFDQYYHSNNIPFLLGSIISSSKIDDKCVVIIEDCNLDLPKIQNNFGMHFSINDEIIPTESYNDYIDNLGNGIKEYIEPEIEMVQKKRSQYKRKQLRIVFKIIALIIIGIAIIGIAVTICVSKLYLSHLGNVDINETYEIIISILSFIVLISFYEKMDNANDSNRKRPTYSPKNTSDITTYKTTVKDGKTENTPVLDAHSYMKKNLGKIGDNYEHSQKQAKHSFTLAVCLCIVGIIIIVGSVIVSIIDKDFSPLIPVIGGSVTEFIAATALFVYRKSLSQLNYYHKSLHEDQRYLTNINLLPQLSNTELQDKMLMEIMRGNIKANLIDMAKDDNGRLYDADKLKSSLSDEKESTGTSKPTAIVKRIKK